MQPMDHSRPSSTTRQIHPQSLLTSSKKVTIVRRSRRSSVVETIFNRSSTLGDAYQYSRRMLSSALVGEHRSYTHNARIGRLLEESSATETKEEVLS